jgi:hypothetical protein
LGGPVRLWFEIARPCLRITRLIRTRGRGAVDDDQDFAELNPAIRLDDDELSALERSLTNVCGGKTSHVAHDPVTDQTDPVTHAHRPSLRLLGRPTRGGTCVRSPN